MCLHPAWSTNPLLFKREAGQLVCATCQFQQQMWWQLVWQQVYKSSGSGRPHLLYGLCTPMKHYGEPTQQFGSLSDFTLTVVSRTGVSVKPIFIPAGDRQWETRVPLAVPWAPLTDVNTSSMASSWWPGERNVPPGSNSSSPETGVWGRMVSLLG